MTATPMMSNAAAIAALNAALASLNVGGVAATVSIWSGSLPATCETADDGTAAHNLVTISFGSTTAFPTAVDNSAGGATATASSFPVSGTAGNSGTAAYFRAYSHSGAGSGGANGCILQGTVNTSAADMIISSVTIVASDLVTITSWTVTLPDGSGTD